MVVKNVVHFSLVPALVSKLLRGPYSDHDFSFGALPTGNFLLYAFANARFNNFLKKVCA
jgi:hypothetical protein